MRSLMARIKRQVVLDDDQGGVQFGLHARDQRTEGFRLALGHARRGFVQADDRRGGGEERGQFDDAAGARRELGHEAVGVATEAQEVDQLGRLAWPAAARHGWRAEEDQGSPERRRLPRLERQLDDFADGELGEERGRLESFVPVPGSLV